MTAYRLPLPLRSMGLLPAWEAFGDLGIDDDILAGPKAVPTYTPGPTSVADGWFAKLTDTVSSAANFVERNSGNAVKLLDAYGRARGKAKKAQVDVGEAIERDVKAPAQVPSWLSDSTLVPGWSNGLVVGAGAGLLVLLLVLKRHPQPTGA